VLGCGFEAAPALAAFANGAMAHCLDYEDTLETAFIHPNAAVVPAALAVAETIGGVTGSDLLIALALGCDLASRIGLSLEGAIGRRFGLRAMAGAIGATAAAGKLLRLGEEALVHAFALTMSQGSLSTAALGYARSDMRAVREAFAAKSGVLSAQLAVNGVRAFEQPFEGHLGWYDLHTGDRSLAAGLLDGLGHDYLGTRVSFKPWPSCRGTHACIEATLNLVARHQISVSAVDKITLTVNAAWKGLCEPTTRRRRPQTAMEAKSSLPFVVASALLNGPIKLTSFTPAAIHDEKVLSLVDRIDCVLRDGQGDWATTAGAVSLYLCDGRVLSETIVVSLGHPERPMSDSALMEKFLECVSYAYVPVERGRAVELGEAIMNLEATRDIAELFLPLRRASWRTI